MHALIHLRQLRRYERQQRERVWEDDDAQPKASDIQVGVLGLGVMGQDAVTKLKALGFKVAGWSASPKSLPDVACFSGVDGLEAHAGANRHARGAAAADRRHARNRQRVASLAAQTRRPARRPSSQCRTRRLQVETDILAALDSGALKGARSMSSSVSPCLRICVSGRIPRHVSPHNAAISSPTRSPTRRPILINAGRGGLQVEADILAALNSGALKGASLDVFEREPLPRIRASGRILQSTSARIMRRSLHPRRSPHSSPARSRRTNAASRSPMWSTAAAATEPRRQAQ